MITSDENGVAIGVGSALLSMWGANETGIPTLVLFSNEYMDNVNNYTADTDKIDTVPITDKKDTVPINEVIPYCASIQFQDLEHIKALDNMLLERYEDAVRKQCEAKIGEEVKGV